MISLFIDSTPWAILKSDLTHVCELSLIAAFIIATAIVVLLLAALAVRSRSFPGAISRVLNSKIPESLSYRISNAIVNAGGKITVPIIIGEVSAWVMETCTPKKKS